MKLFRFLEFPSSLKYSAFSTFYNTEGKRKIPTHFGWLTEPGLYTGMYTYYSSKKTNKVVVIFLPFLKFCIPWYRVPVQFYLKSQQMRKKLTSFYNFEVFTIKIFLLPRTLFWLNIYCYGLKTFVKFFLCRSRGAGVEVAYFGSGCPKKLWRQRLGLVSCTGGSKDCPELIIY